MIVPWLADSFRTVTLVRVKRARVSLSPSSTFEDHFIGPAFLIWMSG